MSKMSEIAAAQVRMRELNDIDFWDLSKADQRVLRAEYQQVRTVLLGYFGPHVDCALVDPWSLDTYSDLYKDKHGVRPRNVPTYAQVQDLLNDPATRVEVDPAEEEQEELEEEGIFGDRFDPDLESLPDDVEPTSTLDEALDYQDRYGSSPFAELTKLKLL